MLRLTLALIFGAATGAVTAWWAIGGFGTSLSGQSYAMGAGYWNGDLAIGSRDADAYTRARIARTGLLALSREETIYFFRNRDSSGDIFRENCTYRMTGGALPSRWWSVTLYANDDFLAQNENDAHSISASDAAISEEEWAAHIGGAKPDDGSGWLSTEAAGQFSLTLRLYNPEPSALDAPSDISFPQIERVACEGDKA